MASQGFMVPTRENSPGRMRRINAAVRLMANVMQGREEPWFLREALKTVPHPMAAQYIAQKYPGIIRQGQYGLRETMSYSDYSALTVDILDRMLYGYYTAAPITNEPLVRKHTLRDFRLVARYEMDGGTTPWSSNTPLTGTAQTFPTFPHGAGEPPTERAMQQAAREVLGSTQRVTYQPQLYQAKMAVNWRAIVNDDLGIFRDATQRLAIGGRRTIYQFITSLYVDANGPHATLYNSTFANLITTTYGAQSNNPPLSFQGLIDGITVLEKMLDIDGQPITFEGQLYLWHGPSLATTAQALMKAIQADISVGGGTGGTFSTPNTGFPAQRLRVGTDYVVRNMVAIQDKYIPLTATSASGSIKNTMWGLMYDPQSQNRPALELGQLAGYETPQLMQKVPNTMRLGGGVDPMLGDFYTMDQEYKGVLVLGGTQIDGRSTVASTGAGA